MDCCGLCSHSQKRSAAALVLKRHDDRLWRAQIHTKKQPPPPPPKPANTSLQFTSPGQSQPCSMVTPLPQTFINLVTQIQSIMHHILPRSPFLSLAPSWLPTSCSLKTKNILITKQSLWLIDILGYPEHMHRHFEQISSPSALQQGDASLTRSNDLMLYTLFFTHFLPLYTSDLSWK